MHVLGTAGHVDHGKSTLIQALTGIDPDRLAEEKARGLTIDLGFAWMELPSGREVGIVDVPGHERFVHNMLAGTGSIDATIFVVAANEGWMPQSEEHVQILDLLGARGGIVALTKIDAAGEDADRVEKEIRERLSGTVLEGAPVVRVSARTGEGLDALRDELDRLLDRTPEAPDAGRPRLFVDRSFSIKGAGTVVTGTLTGGALGADEEIEVAPAGTRARIRGVQTHRRSRDRAEPGSRVALNIAGLDRHEIRRGDAIVKPGQWLATRVLGVRLRGVRTLGHALVSRGDYKIYLGAAEADARLTLLDAQAVGAGEECFARLTLGHDIVATEGDRFVLRDTGRRETVAGGVVLDAHPAPGRVSRAEAVRRLQARKDAGQDAAALAVAERGVVAAEELSRLTGGETPAGAVRLKTHAIDPRHLDDIAGRIQAALERFHGAEPLARGMPRDDLRRASGAGEARLFSEILEHFAARFEADGTLVRIAGHRVRLSPEQEAARSALLRDAAGMSPPALADLEKRHGDRLVRALIDSGDLVKIGAGIALTGDALAAAKTAIAEAIGREGPLTASRIREILGTSRKYAIPLLEFLDAAGFTRREGDLRSVR